MSLKILVVDDNRDTLRSYLKALKRKISSDIFTQGIDKAKIEVEEADNVSLALEKLRTRSFEILVVDLKIPSSTGEEMGGLELITESMKLDPLRPIIAITGHGTVSLAKKALAKGVFDFIEKSSTAVEDLINSVQRALDRRDEKILRSGNPFTRMSGMEPAIFGGRTEEFEFFEQRLNRVLHHRLSEHFIVLGDWGIGKSSLLREYKKICQSRGHIASLVPLEPLQPNTRLIEAVLSIVEGILRDLPYPVSQFNKITDFFASLGITVLGTGLQFSRDTSNKMLSPQAFLHDTLVKLWEDLAEKHKAGVLVILLDDLDNFLPVPEIVMTLKQTLSMDTIKKTRILVGIAAPTTNWQELVSIKKHHPLSRYFISMVTLASLNEGEVQGTIFKSLAGTGVSFNTEIIKRIFKYSVGHPFEMQVLCYHLFNNQLSGRVEIDVWEKALQATLMDMGTAIFDFWFGQASREESKVLSIIAEEESPLLKKDIEERIIAGKIKISSQNVAKYLQRLVEKGLISKGGRGVYIIQDQMFRAYICSKTD
jgi:CheY-like chemotaxis protein